MSEDKIKESNVVNELTTFQLLIILFIFVILISIGFMIKETNLKISYYLSVGLGIFTIINIYLTITYYLQLRNKRGEKGLKGPVGDPGPTGDSGTCVFRKQCGEITDCNNKIYKEVINKKLFDDKISEECLKEPNKKNCRDENIVESALLAKNFTDELVRECKETNMDEKTFLERIKPQLQTLE